MIYFQNIFVRKFIYSDVRHGRVGFIRPMTIFIIILAKLRRIF